MSLEIRAMSLLEILDQSFRLLKQNFVLLVAISAVVNVPLALVAELFRDAASNGLPDASSWMIFGGVLLVGLIAMPWTQLAVTLAIAESALGHACTFDRAYRETTHRYVAYLGTGLLAGLGVIAGLLLFILPGIYFGVLWALFVPILVIEGPSGPSGLGRSRALVTENWWHTFGTFVVSVMIGIVLSGAASWVFTFVPVIGALLDGLVQSVAFAFYAVVVVVLYFDLRCRAEDFDLQLLAREIGEDAGRAPIAPR